MTRVLILTGAPLAARLAGPAIRASAMARVLTSDGHQVILATTGGQAPDMPRVPWTVTSIRPGDERAFKVLERSVDVIVFQGHAMEQFRGLAKTRLPLVADAYDPMHLEMLEQGREYPAATWDMMVRSRIALLNHQLARADLVLCASPRQRMLYLGQLAALGRVNRLTYVADPSLGQLLAIAPFGLEAGAPAVGRPAVRGVTEGVGADERIIIWGGGLYNWFDPLLLIRAVHRLWERRPSVRLVFLGTKSPGVAPMGIVRDAIDLADSLGATGRSVIFNEEWVPFDERGAFLAEANAGVSTHHVHVETEFSFRTRILDYLWAGLPMVVTEGDGFADLVASEGLGAVVPAGDVEALEAAIEKVLFDVAFAESARSNVARVREQFLWERTLVPLRAFVAQPRLAEDVAAAGGRRRLARRVPRLMRPFDRPGLWRDLRLSWHYVRHGGLAEVRRRVATRRGSRS